jgi:hypothetical protein
MKKYLWAFAIFIILIISGIISVVAEILEFFIGVSLIGIGLLAALVLYIYVKVKGS